MIKMAEKTLHLGKIIKRKRKKTTKKRETGNTIKRYKPPRGKII